MTLKTLDGGSYTGRTLLEIYRKMCRHLNVSGPRILYAEGDGKQRVQASMYENGSFIWDKRGREIHRS